MMREGYYHGGYSPYGYSYGGGHMAGLGAALFVIIMIMIICLACSAKKGNMM